MTLSRKISIVVGVISFIGICVICIFRIAVDKTISEDDIALLSSLTIVFLTSLYVTTTIDQTSSMFKQIEEMKNDRKFQQQPLIIPTIEEFIVDAPKLFFSPPTKKYTFGIRAHVTLKIRNISQIPVVNLRVKGILYTMRNDEKFIESDCCSAEDAVGCSADACISMMFLITHPNEFCNVLRSQNTPFIDIEVIYNNIMGAHFVVRKQFSIFQKDSDNKLIVKWHSDLVSFETNEKENLLRLYALLRNNQDTTKSFNQIKNKYMYNPSYIKFNTYYVPGYITTETINDVKYKELTSSYFYGRRIKTISTLPCEKEQ